MSAADELRELIMGAATVMRFLTDAEVDRAHELRRLIELERGASPVELAGRDLDRLPADDPRRHLTDGDLELLLSAGWSPSVPPDEWRSWITTEPTGGAGDSLPWLFAILLVAVLGVTGVLIVAAT